MVFPRFPARWPGSGLASTPCDSRTDHQGRCCRRRAAAAAAAAVWWPAEEAEVSAVAAGRRVATPASACGERRSLTVAMATGRGRPTSGALRCATQSDWLSHTVVMAMQRGRPTSVALRRAALFDWLSEGTREVIQRNTP